MAKLSLHDVGKSRGGVKAMRCFAGIGRLDGAAR